MKNIFLFILLSLCSAHLWGQTISGRVIDAKDKTPLPYVNVYQQLDKGTFTDEEGRFTLQINNQDSLYSSLLSYETTALPPSKIKDGMVIKMEAQSFSLETVEITGKKEQLGRKIMREVAQRNEKLRKQIDDNPLQVGSYRRSVTRYYYEPSKKDTVDTIPGIKVGALLEELSTHYQLENNYKKVVSAERNEIADDRLKKYSRFNIDDSYSGGNLGISYNVTDIFLQPQDMLFDLRDAHWSNPNISDRPIPSPLRSDGIMAYQYTLSNLEVNVEGDTTFTVAFEPIVKTNGLFSGSCVIDYERNLDSCSFFIKKPDNLLIDSVLLSIVYNDTQAKYPEDLNLRYRSKLDKQYYLCEHLIDYFDQTRFSPDTLKFSKEIVSYTEEALSRDSAIWLGRRPSQLDQSLRDFVMEQDSIYEWEHSEEYYRQQDSIYNDNSILDFAFKGFGWKNRSRGLTTSFDPLLSTFQFNHVGGIRLNQGGRVTKEFLNAQQLSMGYLFNYGISNQDLKARFSMSYTYLPKRFARFYGSIGNMYDIITARQTFEEVISPRNLINVKNLGFGHAIEVVNGLYLDVFAEYAIKESIKDFEFPEWSEVIFGNNNEPLSFETYRALFFKTEIIYKFNQRYISRGPRKLLLSNYSPTVKLTLRNGIPAFKDSEVNFGQWTLELYKRPKPRRIGSTNWRVTAGGFAYKKNLRVIEHRYFRGQNLIFFSDPLQNLQRLPSTLNTNENYLQAGIIHHFDGFFLNQVPLINYLKMEVIGGAAGLALEENNFKQVEAYVGLGKKFRLFKETCQVAVYRVFSWNTEQDINQNWVIGFNIYDPFNGQWLY